VGSPLPGRNFIGPADLETRKSIRNPRWFRKLPKRAETSHGIFFPGTDSASAIPVKPKESACGCRPASTPPRGDRVVRGGLLRARAKKPSNRFWKHSPASTAPISTASQRNSPRSRWKKSPWQVPDHSIPNGDNVGPSAREKPSNGRLVGEPSTRQQTNLTIRVPLNEIESQTCQIHFHPLTVRGRYNVAANDMAETIYDAGDRIRPLPSSCGVVRVRFHRGIRLARTAIRCAIDDSRAAGLPRIGRGNRKEKRSEVLTLRPDVVEAVPFGNRLCPLIFKTPSTYWEPVANLLMILGQSIFFFESDACSLSNENSFLSETQRDSMARAPVR